LIELWETYLLQLDREEEEEEAAKKPKATTAIRQDPPSTSPIEPEAQAE